jgi:HAD superfamily hydrolase (TIGR01450 family)
MTSAYAAGRWFQEQGAAGKTVYVVGEAGLRAELEAAGMVPVEYDEERRIDFVVAGWDRQFSYAKMAEAHFAIGRGARFVATNRDVTYPDAGGRTLPGGGAIVASIEACTGVTPVTIGKPEPYTLDLLLRTAGASRDECLVIGDRLDTDIAIGRRVGARTALVLTGVSTREEAERAPEQMRPDVVWETLAEMN